jgi:DNA-binding MarR family transcriptional regulator
MRYCARGEESVEEIDSARLETALAILRQASVRVALLSDPLSPEAGHTLRAVAERLYAERRKRDEFFPAGLFGEPAWDLLLALYMAHDDGRHISLDEAYAAANIDPGDGPALVAKLVAAGLVGRSHNRANAILLTDHGSERLSDYLADLI